MVYSTVIVCILFCVVNLVNGHGRLWDPPSRSTMFRKGFNTPRNYEDNQLYCGGLTHQWEVNHGKCGLCGDPYEGPRDNEAGGKYATGTISAHYNTGQAIDITVELTANHKGWFEFRLCPSNNPKKAITQECLNQYQLQLADGSGNRDYIDHRNGMRTRKWKLPAGLTCTQCVLQWKYHAGNNFGKSADAPSGCVGCGPQEEFYGCSDIAIDDPNSPKTAGIVASKKKLTQIRSENQVDQEAQDLLILKNIFQNLRTRLTDQQEFAYTTAAPRTISTTTVSPPTTTVPTTTSITTGVAASKTKLNQSSTGSPASQNSLVRLKKLLHNLFKIKISQLTKSQRRNLSQKGSSMLGSDGQIGRFMRGNIYQPARFY